MSKQNGSYDSPQDVCPMCHEADLDNGPVEDDGRIFVTCYSCGYQWHEPAEQPDEPKELVDVDMLLRMKG